MVRSVWNIVCTWTGTLFLCSIIVMGKMQTARAAVAMRAGAVKLAPPTGCGPPRWHSSISKRTRSVPLPDALRNGVLSCRADVLPSLQVLRMFGLREFIVVALQQQLPTPSVGRMLLSALACSAAAQQASLPLLTPIQNNCWLGVSPLGAAAAKQPCLHLFAEGCACCPVDSAVATRTCCVPSMMPRPRPLLLLRATAATDCFASLLLMCTPGGI